MSFEQLNRVQEPLSAQLMQRLEEHFGFDLVGDPIPVDGGDESAIFVVGAHVVRIAPRWKTDEELVWIHALVRHVSETVPEAVAPIAAPDGTTLLRHNGYPISVFPFIEGEQMDDEPEDVVRDTGALLARVHDAMATWPGRDQRRPPYSDDSYMGRVQVELPEHLYDEDLVAWHTGLRTSGEPQGLIHGDFYERNLHVLDGRIVGLFDWDEAHIDYLAQEIAWSMWEFSHDEDKLDEDYAHAFIDGFVIAAGELPASFDANATEFVRWRLRDEMQRQLTAKSLGEPFDEEYFQSEERAFKSLR